MLLGSMLRVFEGLKIYDISVGTFLLSIGMLHLGFYLLLRKGFRRSQRRRRGW
jgi:hypothetical protein